MSSPLSFEHLEHIREGARLMVERTRAHEHDLNELVETAEGVAHQAGALAGALARADATADELPRLCSAQLRRSADTASATRRACVSARERHLLDGLMRLRISM